MGGGGAKVGGTSSRHYSISEVLRHPKGLPLSTTWKWSPTLQAHRWCRRPLVDGRALRPGLHLEPPALGPASPYPEGGLVPERHPLQGKAVKHRTVPSSFSIPLLAPPQPLPSSPQIQPQSYTFSLGPCQLAPWISASLRHTGHTVNKTRVLVRSESAPSWQSPVRREVPM